MITRIFKITVAVFAILLLGIIGGLATTVMAEETSADAILIHIDINGNETPYNDFKAGIDYARENGGTLKLLRNYDASGVPISCVNTDYTFDLNGFTLDGSYMIIGGGEYTGTLMLIDTSVDKTGILNNSGVTNVAYGGTMIIDGAKYVSSAKASYDATVIVKNVSQSNVDVSVGIGAGLLQLINVRATEELYICFEGATETAVEISGGQFGSITVDENGSANTIADLIKDGYVCVVDDKIVSADTTYLENVEILPHTHDFSNEYIISMGAYHANGCICGKIAPNAELSKHTLNEDGVCDGCSMLVAAQTEIDNEILYYTDALDALLDLFEGEKGTLKLLSDGQISKSFIECYSGSFLIDLNGKHLDILTNLEIKKDAALTIDDTSNEKSGAIFAEQSNYTCINVLGSLIIENGRIDGIIDTYGDEDSYANVTVNGGVFTGTVFLISYDYSNIYVNGGIFSNDTSTFEIFASCENTVNIEIISGVFEKGIVIGEDIDSRSILSLIPDNECELIFVDKNGNEAPLDGYTYEYRGYLRLRHKDEKIIASEDNHAYYCEKCDIILATVEHGPFTYQIDPNNFECHLVICTVCDYELESIEHSGGKSTCSEGAYCDYCGEEYGQINVAAHTGGNATCTNKAVCTLCKKEYGEINPSNHSSTDTIFVQNKNDVSKHDKIYVCCNEIIDTGSHENGIATCTDKGICTECNLEYGSEPSGHKYDSNCDASCNVCNQLREISGHKYDNACDTECNECKLVREVAHTYSTDGACIVCGNTVAPSAQPKNGMGTGALIITILATVVVFGGGTFSLIWFVLRKKF